MKKSRYMSAVERFFRSFDASGGPDACWLWTAGRRRGYGRIQVNGELTGAHRFSFQFFCGPIPAREDYHGTVVMHTCDTRACVNPAHLRLGAHSDNVADRDQKGRQARGDRNANTKLTAEDVRAIRSESASLRQMGRRFGVCYSNISSIRRRKTWASVVVILAMLSTGCASKGAFRAAQGTFVASQILDVVSTHAAISAGAIEANPMLPTGWQKQIAIKSAESAAVLWLSKRLSKEHRTLAAILLSGMSVGYSLIAIRNYQIARGAR